MTYLDDLADAIQREVDPDLVPSGDTRSLFRLYAVLALAKGTEVSAEDVHNAWAAWISESNPDHRAVKPFHELARDVQDSDQPFVDAIRRVASEMAP